LSDILNFKIVYLPILNTGVTTPLRGFFYSFPPSRKERKWDIISLLLLTSLAGNIIIFYFDLANQVY